MASYSISATSGTVTTKLVVSEKYQSIDNNQTELSWALYMWNTGSWYSYDSKNAFNVTIDGTVVWNTSSYGRVSLPNGMSESAAILMGSGSVTITHNADGTKTVPIYFRAAQEWQNPPLYLWTSSDNFKLTTIARASQPSCISFPNTTQNIGKMGDTIIIHMNRASSSFTHVVKYQWSSASGTIASNVGDNCKWTIPKDFANYIPSATNGIGNIIVDTYSGNTYIGTKTVGFTVYISDDMKPSISAFELRPVNSNSILQNWNILVKGQSRFSLYWNAAGAYSSSLSYFVISFNGVVSNVGNGYTTGVLGFSGNTTLYYKVVDSRGMESETYSYTFTIYDYSAPKISTFSVYRIEGQQQSVASYAVYSASSINGNNSIKSAILYYKKTGSSNWITYSGDISSGETIAIQGFNEASSYEFELWITDTIGNTSQRTVYVGTAAVLLDFRAGGKGLSVGKISEKNAFEVGMSAEFNQKVNFKKGFNIANSAGKDGTSCWVCVAQISIGSAYSNFPIEFTIARRGMPEYSRLTLIFKNENTLDPDVSSFVYSGGYTEAVIRRIDAGTWKLYINKSEAYDNILLADVKNNWNWNADNTIITYPEATISDSKPVGGIDAIPIIKYDGANLSLLNENVWISPEYSSIYNGGILLGNTGDIRSKTAVYAGENNTYSSVIGSSTDYGWLALYDRNNKKWLNEIGLYSDKTMFTQMIHATEGVTAYKGFELIADKPYLDFHFGNSSGDYTARIIENTQGTLTAYNSISSASDVRLKKEVAELPESYIKLVENLTPHIYRFINGSDYMNAGLIAQEVIALEKKMGITESVLVRGTGKDIKRDDGKIITDYYSIDYNALLILLLKYTVTKIQKMEESI